MLVIDLSASNSIGRAVVVFPLNVKKEKKIWRCLCLASNKHVFGIGKGKWKMVERGIFQVWIKTVNFKF
jgi:hypothetical protein